MSDKPEITKWYKDTKNLRELGGSLESDPSNLSSRINLREGRKKKRYLLK